MHVSKHFKEVSKELLYLSLPMAVTQFIMIGSIFIAMAMVARLGRDVLAASALIYSARLSIIIISGSILFSLSILIGRAFGEGEYNRIGNYVQQGWTLAAIISIPVMLLFWHIDKILLLFGQQESLTLIVQTFFHANIYSVLPFLLVICNQQLCYGTRKQKIDLVVNIFSAFVLLILTYVLVFGHFGFPKLGVSGLGYAMALQAIFQFCFSSFIIIRADYFKKFNLFNYRVHHNLRYLAEMFKIGWPICVQIGGELLSLFFSAAMVGWLGSRALASYQVVNQYLFLIIVPLFALAQASGVLVGQFYGEKHFNKIRTLGFNSLIFALFMALTATLIFLLAPTQLAAVYINTTDPKNTEILYLIRMLFAIAAISLIFDGIRNVTTGALRGLFDTQYPMYVGLFVIWLIGIPLGYILAFHFELGVAGIVLGSAIGMFIGAILVLLRWRRISNTLCHKLVS